MKRTFEDIKDCVSGMLSVYNESDVRGFFPGADFEIARGTEASQEVVERIAAEIDTAILSEEKEGSAWVFLKQYTEEDDDFRRAEKLPQHASVCHKVMFTDNDRGAHRRDFAEWIFVLMVEHGWFIVEKYENEDRVWVTDEGKRVANNRKDRGSARNCFQLQTTLTEDCHRPE
ncbi:MAG: hypothetical protein ACI4OD_01175 [Selenomonas sp.]